VLLMGLVALFCSHILLAGIVCYEADHISITLELERTTFWLTSQTRFPPTSRRTQRIPRAQTHLTWFSGNDTQVYTILTAMLNPDNMGGMDFAFSTPPICRDQARYTPRQLPGA
jgi:hypothetical protein